jgi:peptidoglycan/LPS O-acetylase OafA/YrhL
VRNRYLDLLRAAAIVRVIVYHLFGWPWLSIVLPAMGVMFALAGSLTAASLDKRGAGSVVVSRLRRLLPPLWLLGVLAVPVMLALGWAHEIGGQTPFSAGRLLLWIVPVGDPPGSDKNIDVWEPLWYIRAYLWFVVLSPVMYRAYKRFGWWAVVAPIGLIAVLDRTGFGLPDLADAAMWDFVTFAACWMAGFAHHDRRLHRTRSWLLVVAALLLGAAALYWLNGHPGPDGYDLNDVTESQALWSLAFVLIVLRWQPPIGWLARIRPLDRAVTLLNGRAVTIYLWHNIAIAAVWPALTLVALDDLNGALGNTVDLVTALLLTAFAVLAFGWVEDVAARRRPRLWPIVDTPRLSPARPDVAGEPGARHAAAGTATDDLMPWERHPPLGRPRRASPCHTPQQPPPPQVTPASPAPTGGPPAGGGAAGAAAGGATIDGTIVGEPVVGGMSFHGPALGGLEFRRPVLRGPAADPATATARPVVQFGLAPLPGHVEGTVPPVGAAGEPAPREPGRPASSRPNTVPWFGGSR